jgi:hypothetical protein
VKKGDTESDYLRTIGLAKGGRFVDFQHPAPAQGGWEIAQKGGRPSCAQGFRARLTVPGRAGRILGVPGRKQGGRRLGAQSWRAEYSASGLGLGLGLRTPRVN